MNSIVSQYKIHKKQFEQKYSDLLKDMYEQFNLYWRNYPAAYHVKKPISYDDFVSYCYSISVSK
jgi:hypothetical protein